jgi:5-formyltetrahydrofolate cyclo-ligase
MKHHLRREMKATLAGMSAQEAAAASEAACSALLGLEEYREARSVMLYAPIPGEVDCIPVAQAAWRDGRTVLLPRVTGEHGHMAAVRCGSLDDEMIVSAKGIREPAAGEPWPVGGIDFIVVPALAYDRQGNRLGRGGGFYDRFLAQADLRAVTCGLAFRQQVIEELPVHSNDYPVDLLVTDEEVLRFRRRPKDRQLDLFRSTSGKRPARKETGP